MSELHPDHAQAEAAACAPLAYDEYGVELPPALLRFKHIPDLSRMQPGDIVLVQPRSAPAFLRSHWWIQQTQSKLVPESYAGWIHAALYVGRDMVVEAVPPRVTVNAFSRYAPTHRIKVRRCPKLGEADVFKACVEALRWIGTPYNNWDVLGFGMAYVGGQPPKQKLIERSFICSNLIHLAFLHGISRPIVKLGNTRAPTPADLAMSSSLHDVAIGWRRLAGTEAN